MEPVRESRSSVGGVSVSGGAFAYVGNELDIFSHARNWEELLGVRAATPTLQAEVS